MQVFDGYYTIDGAGVRLFRIFANDTVKITDPFLLLDCFGSDEQKDYIKGFPWHPHRGIETVTYVLKGDVEHQDSLGNKGIISSGDIQWMSAGSGIIHQEMPQGPDGMKGFQLWINMPSNKKMNPPRYRELKEEHIPTIKNKDMEIRIIAGNYNKKKSPLKEMVLDVTYLDITLLHKQTFEYNLEEYYAKDHTVLCLVIEGEGVFESKKLVEKKLLLLKDIKKLSVNTAKRLRFLLIHGKPLKEPIAWGGPIVMNTQEELREAFSELNDGTFVKK